MQCDRIMIENVIYVKCFYILEYCPRVLRIFLKADLLPSVKLKSQTFLFYKKFIFVILF